MQCLEVLSKLRILSRWYTFPASCQSERLDFKVFKPGGKTCLHSKLWVRWPQKYYICFGSYSCAEANCPRNRLYLTVELLRRNGTLSKVFEKFQGQVYRKSVENYSWRATLVLQNHQITRSRKVDKIA